MDIRLIFLSLALLPMEGQRFYGDRPVYCIKNNAKNKGEVSNLTVQYPERHSSPGQQLAQSGGHRANGQEELWVGEGAKAAWSVQGREGHGSPAAGGEARPCQRSPDARTQLTRLDVRTRVCLCGGLQPEGWNVGDSLSSTLPHQNPRPVRRPIPRL